MEKFTKTGPNSPDMHYFLLTDFPLKTSKKDAEVIQSMMSMLKSINPDSISD